MLRGLRSCNARVLRLLRPRQQGVGAGLGNVLKLEDGEPLSGGATAEDDFGDIAPTAESEFGLGSTGGFGGFLD
ncbi:Protein of uncharacterised function (DUF2815) [Corynebacterium kutscheri]|uniref:Protein of uncharacterized function (DUF2815) n=1 Tax=Corynebacterium kutscheri TaxID=35755 RepID=A0AB38VSH4_9CORY|nr:Protein of uncharacterised function (DUF2815) [Corynebacterium kutscheri]VEH09399.1 Protein of uncharacterised function (DUF2815) [Corynebacterium kutscheri]VEH79485.1 Protein of uncharacterised function (DUF2815) [Corynebacterium kutscheri]